LQLHLVLGELESVKRSAGSEKIISEMINPAQLNSTQLNLCCLYVTYGRLQECQSYLHSVEWHPTEWRFDWLILPRNI